MPERRRKAENFNVLGKLQVSFFYALGGLNSDFKADILNVTSDHLCVKVYLIAHIEQHGHRKPLS